MFPIAIVVPTKNRADLLAETIRSVQVQSSPNWQLIVVDDGSTDRTSEMMEGYIRSDERIQFLKRQKETSGANVCRNEGAAAARADWLMFLDSDDLLSPTCIENRCRWMQRNQDMDFVVCHADAFLKEPGDLKRPASVYSLEGDLDRFLYFDLPWLVTGPTWRKEAFLRIGGFDESIPSWQDVELHVRALLMGLHHLNLPITDYHVRWQNEPTKTSLQQSRSEQHLIAGERTIDSFERMLYEHQQVTWSRLRGIASLRLNLANMWGNQSRWPDARRVWRKVKHSKASSIPLYYGGLASLLCSKFGLSQFSLIARVIHFWKGLVRLRQQAKLVNSQASCAKTKM